MPVPWSPRERTVSELGGIDILVNNAGILVTGPLEDFKLADFDRTLAINVRAVFVATQAAVNTEMIFRDPRLPTSQGRA